MTRKILLVDDEANVLSAYRRQLRKRFEIETAEGAERALAYISVASAILLGIVTFVLLTREAFLAEPGEIVYILLMVDIAALGLLLFFVGRQVYTLFAERRRRLAGNQLHLRLVTLFGFITIAPAIIIVAFSLFVLDYSLRGWFS